MIHTILNLNKNNITLFYMNSIKNKLNEYNSEFDNIEHFRRLRSIVNDVPTYPGGKKKRKTTRKKTKRRKTRKIGGNGDDELDKIIPTGLKYKPGATKLSQNKNNSVWNFTSSINEGKEVSKNTINNTTKFNPKQQKIIFNNIYSTPSLKDKTTKIRYDDMKNETYLIPNNKDIAEFPKFIKDISAAHYKREKLIEYIKKNLMYKYNEIMNGDG